MAAGAQATLDTLARYKLRSSVLDMPIDFRSTEAAFETGMSQIEAMAEFAARIDCPLMTARIDPSGPLPMSEWRPIQLRRIRAIAAALSQQGVRLALEFVGSADIRRLQPHEFLWRMNDVLCLIEEAGNNVGLLLDSWHWHYAGATLDDILCAGRDRIFHVHLNDAPDQPFEAVIDKQRLMPGDGVIDLTGFLSALRTIGYNGAVSVEVFGGSLATIDPLEGAKLGFESTMRVFRKAGVA